MSAVGGEGTPGEFDPAMAWQIDRETYTVSDAEGSDLARALADALRGFLEGCTPTDDCHCVDCEGLRALAAWDTQERETNENEADR